MWARTAESSHMIVQSTRDSFYGESGFSHWLLYLARRDVYLEEGVKGGEDVGLVVVPTEGVVLGPVHFAVV